MRRDTDSLYVDLSDKLGVEIQKVSSGVVFDFDGAGRIYGNGIDSTATYLLSESALAKDWLRPEEEDA